MNSSTLFVFALPCIESGAACASCVRDHEATRLAELTVHRKSHDTRAARPRNALQDMGAPAGVAMSTVQPAAVQMLYGAASSSAQHPAGVSLFGNVAAAVATMRALVGAAMLTSFSSVVAADGEK